MTEDPPLDNPWLQDKVIVVAVLIETISTTFNGASGYVIITAPLPSDHNEYPIKL